MRKSEADHLLEHLRRTYEGPLTLEVWNLARRGPQFYFEGGEHPFFVVGYHEGSGEEAVRREEQTRQEILVWNERGKKITVERRRTRRLSEEAGMHESELYIYDTRRREFVPVSRFHLPPDPS